MSSRTVLLLTACSISFYALLGCGDDEDASPPCGELEQSECDAREECESVRGWVTGDSADGGSEFIGCRTAGTGSSYVPCGAALTCARQDDGECALFGTTCVPDGWTTMECDAGRCP